MVASSFVSFNEAVDWAMANYTWLRDLPREQAAARLVHVFRQNADGTWRLHYDPAIAVPRASDPAERARGTEALWQGFRSFRCPLLLVRGAETDLLSLEIVAQMRAAQPEMQVVEVPGVGHAPALAEPVARRAIQAFFGLEAEP